MSELRISSLWLFKEPAVRQHGRGPALPSNSSSDGTVGDYTCCSALSGVSQLRGLLVQHGMNERERGGGVRERQTERVRERERDEVLLWG